ncbi:hypothetical protein JTE90_012820 [Oedothorax gibbosus]|uniref:Uncharacterized protein n=1 Tax=Oedothorax gibbosus TaxID=931172 RepID=A0AAV6W3V8_9ARAC|nr:hypothetical protein JTE90_012820 [Oedothorax gibbosus]
MFLKCKYLTVADELGFHVNIEPGTANLSPADVTMYSSANGNGIAAAYAYIRRQRLIQRTRNLNPADMTGWLICRLQRNRSCLWYWCSWTPQQAVRPQTGPAARPSEGREVRARAIYRSTCCRIRCLNFDMDFLSRNFDLDWI